MRVLGRLLRLILVTVLVGGVVAVVFLPYAVGAGESVLKAANVVQDTPIEQMDLPMPLRSTIVDSTGRTIAYIYDQDRAWVPLTQISPYLQQGIISIEDRHFYSDNGVDWRSTVRAALEDAAGKTVYGGSTLTQQLVKNYEFLVAAQNPAQQAAATSDTVSRKVDQTLTALAYARTHSKAQILESYLNLVPFGPSTYGAEAGAERFFGVHADQLTLPQAALMAAMVNNPNLYDPLDPAQVPDAIARRNQVLADMARDGNISAAAAAAAERQGLELHPTTITNGCVDAPDAAEDGYFCEYVLQYLQQAGISYAALQTGGYTITTTMNPAAMADAHAAVTESVSPTDPAAFRIANVMAIIKPGEASHDVVALVANRPFGPDAAAGATEQLLPTAFEPLGAGSTFKIFTTAAAMEAGIVGTDSVIPVPDAYTSPLNPGHVYTNLDYGLPSSMTVSQALAISPNTAFVDLEDRVGLGPITDMAVALGMKGYLLPAGQVDPTFAGSSDDYANEIATQGISSFTLGVSPVSPLELANVGATLDSEGWWCPPTPVQSITGRNGSPIAWHQQDCVQAVPSGLADTLTAAMYGDMHDPDGTAYASAQAAGWTGESASKTGTTENSQSSAFLGYTPSYSASDIVWDYLTDPESVCVQPVRSCTLVQANADGQGLTGGSLPAQSWLAAMTPLQSTLADMPFPAPDPAYEQAGTQQPATTSASPATTTPNPDGLGTPPATTPATG